MNKEGVPWSPRPQGLHSILALHSAETNNENYLLTKSQDKKSNAKWRSKRTNFLRCLPFLACNKENNVDQKKDEEKEEWRNSSIILHINVRPVQNTTT